MYVHTHDAQWIRRTYSVDETDFVATRMLCLPGRAGACTIRAAMNCSSTSRSHASGITGTLWDMSWHVTAQFSAEVSKSRCLGTPWRALAYLIDPFLPSNLSTTSPSSRSLHPAHQTSTQATLTSLTCPASRKPIRGLCVDARFSGSLHLRSRPEGHCVSCCVTSQPERKTYW